MKNVFAATALLLLAAGCTSNSASNSTGISTNVALTQSYTNSADHYTFKYPDGYEVRAFEGFGIFAPIKPDSSEAIVTKKGDDNSIFSVDDNARIQQLSPDALKATIRPPFKVSDYSISPVNIGGVQGYKLQYVGSTQDVKSDFYYLQKSGQKVLAVTVVKNNQVAQDILNSISIAE